jgi:hypothetical protein
VHLGHDSELILDGGDLLGRGGLLTAKAKERHGDFFGGDGLEDELTTGRLLVDKMYGSVEFKTLLLSVDDLLLVLVLEFGVLSLAGFVVRNAKTPRREILGSQIQAHGR